jgi:hypothetical protein
MPAKTHEDHIADPRRLSGPQLARLGIQILNRYNLLLQCMTCNETWTPALKPDGTLHQGYWVCPNKCNL